MTIGKQIKAYRERRAMSQYELAQRMSIAPSSICEWEADRREPRYDTLLRLCVALGCSPNDLLGWTDEACTTSSGTTTPEIINPDTTHPHDLKGGNPHMITLNDLLALTNARTVRCTLAVTPRLTATIVADITQTGQLDDLSALYGACEITEVDGRDGCLAVTLRRGGGSHDA
jgi:DNA-binding Xre family transcriptional regulator